MNIFFRWLLLTLAVLLSSFLVPGVYVAGFWSALWVALLMGVINISIKPLLIIITLPINILTLGLFTFVINALMVLLIANVIKGFEVNGFWTAMLFSFVLSLLSYVFNALFKTKKSER